MLLPETGKSRGFTLKRAEVIRRVLLVHLPFHGIVDDIFPDRSQFPVIADNPFEIIALPHRNAGIVAYLVDTFGDNGFELSDDCADGT